MSGTLARTASPSVYSPAEGSTVHNSHTFEARYIPGQRLCLAEVQPARIAEVVIGRQVTPAAIPWSEDMTDGDHVCQSQPKSMARFTVDDQTIKRTQEMSWSVRRTRRTSS
jgi:hypothetical protein